MLSGLTKITRYTLRALFYSALGAVVVLLSPEIGVTPVAKLAIWQARY